MYNRNINRLTAVIQSPIAPRSTNVLWDDLVSNTLKVYRKGIWTVIGGAGGGGEGSSLYWGYDAQAGVIFPLDNRSVQINGDLTVNGDITARKLSVAELEIDGKSFASYWELDTNTNTLSTIYQVHIKNNLIVDQDTSSGGNGQDTPASGIRGIYVNGTPYTDTDGDGFIDLGTISGGGGTADLSNYYTKAQSDGRFFAKSGNGMLSFDGAGRPVMLNNQGYSAYNTNGQIEEVMWLDSSNLLQLGGTTSQKVNIYGELTINYQDAIHSGNIGSYNAGGAKKLTPYNGICDYAAGVSTMSFFTDWGLTNTLGSYLYGISMESPDASYKVQVGHALWKGLYWRDMDAGTWTSWKKIVTENEDGNVGIGTTSPLSKLDVHGSVAVNEYLIVRAWTGYGSGTCNMWYSGTANTLEISSSVKTMHSLTVADNLTVNGFAESTYNRNTGMSSTMYFTSTQWLRIWKGPYGSAVRLQIGKNYYHMHPMVLCVDVSVGYSTAAISVTCNSDAANTAIQAIRVTKDTSGNYYIDVLIYNYAHNTDEFRVCGNSELGHILAFETADNSATVLEQISVVPNASIISNNLIVSGDVASA